VIIKKEIMMHEICLKLTIKADPVLVESISDFLIGVFEAGVETGAPDEPLYGTINAYMQGTGFDQMNVEEITARVSAYVSELAVIFNVSIPKITSMMVEDEDWGKSWKAHFKPFTIVPGLVISPTWEKYQPKPGEQVITMDPGMAFGTGHHATTSLTLECIQETLADTAGLCLLDVGTGTGVLGMAAVLFGAESVYGIDNDSDAVTVATDNVVLNGMQERMRVSGVSLEAVEDQFSVTVANIVHNVLISMVEDLVRITMENGILILSGLLVGEQVENVITTFKLKGFVLLEQKEAEEWAALKFVKRVM
jgi:ribosomal protein L11 methyltransferase